MQSYKNTTKIVWFNFKPCVTLWTQFFHQFVIGKTLNTCHYHYYKISVKCLLFNCEHYIVMHLCNKTMNMHLIYLDHVLTLLLDEICGFVFHVFLITQSSGFTQLTANSFSFLQTEWNMSDSKSTGEWERFHVARSAANRLNPFSSLTGERCKQCIIIIIISVTQCPLREQGDLVT